MHPSLHTADLCIDTDPMSAPTLVDTLHERAKLHPDRMLFSRLADGEEVDRAFSYLEVDTRARAIATRLTDLDLAGSSVVLLYPDGLEFIIAFLGCLYAGAVAVPAYPPDAGRLERTLPRLQAIAADAGARAVLTTGAIAAGAAALAETTTGLGHIRWLATDDLDPALALEWRRPDLTGASLAFLQYTSGSTGDPRGVMVTHGNLLHNERAMRAGFQSTERSTFVTWLPFFHDMGLIGTLLQPMFIGAGCYMMSPMAFLERPIRWLKAITRYGAHITGGPNFGYDLCLRKVKPQERLDLDLSSVRVAFNGAEPIRSETIRRFTAYFAPCGFRPEAFFPCYGLAEATLMVTAVTRDERPTILPVSRRGLEQGEARPVEGIPGVGDTVPSEGVELVSAGVTWLGQELRIVDPETGSRLGEDRVGEIWVAGDSVAGGYWNRPEESARTFHAAPDRGLRDLPEGGLPFVSRLAAAPRRAFLRTGDLGFLHDGHLYVTGRLKDLLILRGRNYYPQDIERTLETAHPAIRPGCCAAFTVDLEHEERLVVAAEVALTRSPSQDDAADVDALLELLRRRIVEEHGLSPQALLLLPRGAIPKTSSGKIRRRACREQWTAGSLEPLAIWREPSVSAIPVAEAASSGAEGENAAVAYVLETMRRALRTPAGLEGASERPIQALGFDSLRTAELKSAFETDLGLRVPLEFVSDDPTPRLLARRLYDLQRATASTGPAADALLATFPRLAARTPARQPLAATPGALSRVSHPSTTPDAGGAPLPPAPIQHAPAVSDTRPRGALLQSRPSSTQPGASRDVFAPAKTFSTMRELQETDMLPFYQEFSELDGCYALVRGHRALMMGSMDYLGLSKDERVRGAAARAALNSGAGRGGSRAHNGSTPEVVAFEQHLARFMGREAGLVFATGYQAMVGLISGLMTPDTTLVLDELAHASNYDGALVSRCRIERFKHNDLEDLERVLARVTAEAATLVMVESLYSNEGDVAPLPGIRALCDRFGARLAVDEAHGFGVLGGTGKGLEERFGMPGAIDVIAGTFSKSLGSVGGWIVGSHEVIEWIRYHGRSILFSAAISPPALAAAARALRVLEEEPDRVARLQSRAAFWKEALRREGVRIDPTDGPIVPILIGDDLEALRVARALLEAGIYTHTVIYPSVPAGGAMLRTCVTAAHEEASLTWAARTIAHILTSSPARVGEGWGEGA